MDNKLNTNDYSNNSYDYYNINEEQNEFISKKRKKKNNKPKKEKKVKEKNKDNNKNDNEKKVKKNVINLKNDFLLLAILELIIIVLMFLFNKNIVQKIINIIYLVLLLIGIKFSKDEKKIAGTIGIIVSILMILSILSLNIVDFLLGIFLLIHSIKYQKMFNNNSDEVIAYDYMDYTDEKNDDTIDYDDIDNYNNEKSNKKSLRINKKLLMIIVILIIVIPFVVFLVFDFYNTFKKTNNVRSISFVATAKEYVRLAQKEVSKTNNPNCNNTDLLVRKIPLSRIIGGTVSSVSPYGNSFDLEASYVEVEASNISGICSYIYSIYLTDGTYSIGGLNNPILESEIDIDKIKK